MDRKALDISLATARRLAVTKQHLAGRLPRKATRDALCAVVRDLAYVQWDPVSIVAPSHIISLWSRLGDFQLSDLDRLLWQEKRLFEHWTPMASIVLTEDYPLYYALMRRYPTSLSHSWGAQRDQARRFLAGHLALRKKMLKELQGGPLRVRDFKDHSGTMRADGEWTPTSDVSHMLFHLLMNGEAMVVGHEGNQNLWGLTEGFLPPGTERGALTMGEFERKAAQRALRALGTATPSEITHYFVRGRYQDLGRTLARLETDSLIQRVRIEGLGTREVRYIHREDIPLLGSMEGRAFTPRMTLLPPFDNLLYDPVRTQRLFRFAYVREQFLPKEKRRYGTYVLPILWGNRLIGRIDPRLEKETGRLRIHAVHAEPDAPDDPAVADMVRATIEGFARFLGANEVEYPSRVPTAWKDSLH